MYYLIHSLIFLLRNSDKNQVKFLKSVCVNLSGHKRFFLLKALASWGGEVSETKNHPLCGCEIKVKQLKNHPFLIK